ncbi:hypothetical protein EA187_20145 [Lujinxingia sediminis]|uniref:Transposase Tn5-like N-terminal domain-containing protein n=1 Tax=Lujinxingia sediminis TaxID=2480984 RepID=A0ABY0CMH1_9DELT|nr:hypothetical protein EA187_20145 [Lujinxingia sediminis]
MEPTTMMADLTLSDELQDVDLGDKRRHERFVRIAALRSERGVLSTWQTIDLSHRVHRSNSPE